MAPLFLSPSIFCSLGVVGGFGSVTSLPPDPQPSPFCHPACPGVPWEQATCLRQVKREMTPQVAMTARPGGPAVQKKPSPEGLGNPSQADLSAVDAALNPDPLASLPLGAHPGAEGPSVRPSQSHERRVAALPCLLLSLLSPFLPYPDFRQSKADLSRRAVEASALSLSHPTHLGEIINPSMLEISDEIPSLRGLGYVEVHPGIRYD
jgi:hypothetical protein